MMRYRKARLVSSLSLFLCFFPVFRWTIRAKCNLSTENCRGGRTACLRRGSDNSAEQHYRRRCKLVLLQLPVLCRKYIESSHYGRNPHPYFRETVKPPVGIRCVRIAGCTWLHNGGWQRKSSKVYLEAIPRRYLPPRYILDCRNNPFSKSRSLLQRKREPGNGKNRRRFLLRDKSGYRCRYQMYSGRKTTSHIFSAASHPEGYSIVRDNILYTLRVQRPKFQPGSWNRALSCFLRVGDLYPTFIQLCTRHSRYENYWL